MVNQISIPSMKITGIEISSYVIIFGVCLNRRRSQAARKNDTWKWQVGGNAVPARREWCPAVWREVCALPGGIKVGASRVEVHMLCPESGQRCSVGCT